MGKRRNVKRGAIKTRGSGNAKSRYDLERGARAELQKQGSFRRLFGKVQWEGSLEESRASRFRE